jgi:hypothetical protein
LEPKEIHRQSRARRIYNINPGWPVALVAAALIGLAVSLASECARGRDDQAAWTERAALRLPHHRRRRSIRFFSRTSVRESSTSSISPRTNSSKPSPGCPGSQAWSSFPACVAIGDVDKDTIIKTLHFNSETGMPQYDSIARKIRQNLPMR